MKFSHIPGGVSSPARAFGAVGGEPIVASHGEGAHLIDSEGNRYIDYIQGFGAVILGHADARTLDAVKDAAARGGAVGLTVKDEGELAERIVSRVPSVEKVRFVTSGTEASMTAARMARAATGRDVIVKFEGNYHGHADAFLAKAGSGVATFSVPMAEGVGEASVSHTVVLPYNDLDAVAKAFDERGEEIAAVFVEPIAANMGCVLPANGYLEGLRDLCSKHGTVLVFDEVVTGFRVGMGGAQELYGISPDLTMLGKVIGGGLPIGAVGGVADLMDLLAPAGPVYQAGTFAAHPHAMAAGVAVLDALDAGAFASLKAKVDRLAAGITESLDSAGAKAVVSKAPTFLSVFFTSSAPQNFNEASASNRQAFSSFHQNLRDCGVLLPPSPFEVWFPSLSHTDADLDRTVAAVGRALTA